MYAPHTVTVYNVTQDQDQDFKDTQKRYITVIRGVSARAGLKAQMR